MAENKNNPKLWAVVMILVAVIGCAGAIIAAAIGILPEMITPETSTTIQATETIIVPSPTIEQKGSSTATTQPTPTQEPSTPTNTPTSTPEGSAVIFIPDYICDEISLSECQCLWPPQAFHSGSDSPMKDTWTLQNIGSGNLILEAEDTTCPECFVVQHNPQIGNVIIRHGSG